MTKSQQEGWFILEDFSQGSLRSTLTVLILTKSLWSNLGFLHARQSTNTSIWLSTNQLWLSVHPITHTSKGMSNIFQVHKGFENLLRKHYIAPCLTSFLYWGFCTRSPQRFSKIKLSLDKPSQVGWKTCLLHIKLTVFTTTLICSSVTCVVFCGRGHVPSLSTKFICLYWVPIHLTALLTSPSLFNSTSLLIPPIYA